MHRGTALTAGVFGLLGVLLGAFGAHGVKGLLAASPDAAQRLAWWETGSLYHLVHALALGLVAVLAHHAPGRASRAAAWLFAAGITLFSGSLYVMTLTGLRSLGGVTPLGGLLLMAAWACVIAGARRL